MKRFVALWLLLLCLPGLADPSPPPADLVFRGGAIYRCDAARSWAWALAVHEGRISALDHQAVASIGPDTEVVEIADGMLLPSFHDAHVHPVTGGLKQANCVLDEAKTEAELEALIADYLQEHPEQPWLVGRGWTLPTFPEGRPTRADLDRLVPDRPAYLVSSDGHNAWVNSRALEIAGIDSETPDPPHGRIERNQGGAPTGILRETAMDLMAPHLPEVTLEAAVEGLQHSLAQAHAYGLTTLHEAHATEDVLAAYHELDRRGQLSARIVASLATDPHGGLDQVPRLRELRESHRGHRLRPEAVKLFVDGVLEGQTAALLEPYLGRGDDRGFLNFEPETLAALVTELDADGFQIHCHAIGDRGIRVALDAFEAAREANGPSRQRHHISHLQLIDPADLARFRRLGVVANIQGLWAFDDRFITELTEPYLGPGRSRWLYPNRSLRDSGAVLVGGSDWSVSSMNPLEAIQVAVTRTDPDRTGAEPWIPEERLTLADMLAAYTCNPAYLAGLEGESGSLEVGRSADLVLLDRNLFEIEPSRIGEARVRRTYLEGQELYRADCEGKALPLPR